MVNLEDFWVYILHCKGGTLYVGQTEEIKTRLDAHFGGNGCEATKKFPPIKLIGLYHVEDFYNQFNKKKFKNLNVEQQKDYSMKLENYITKMLHNKGYKVLGGKYTKINQEKTIDEDQFKDGQYDEVLQLCTCNLPCTIISGHYICPKSYNWNDEVPLNYQLSNPCQTQIKI